MIGELTDGFQDGIVKGHLTSEVSLDHCHADDLCWSDDTVRLVRWVTGLSAPLSIEINENTLLAELGRRPWRGQSSV